MKRTLSHSKNKLKSQRSFQYQKKIFSKNHLCFQNQKRFQSQNAKYLDKFDRTKFFGNLPKSVKIVEVGARDGLQSEEKILSTRSKVKLINSLSQTGLKVIEAGAFVNPAKIPQMHDSEKVLSTITRKKGISYPVLVPNLKGLERALSCGVEEIALFAAASDSFSLKNIGRDVQSSLLRYEEVAKIAKEKGLKMRGYISTVMGCPYEGKIDPSKVVSVSKKLYDLGCYEISLGDTIGVGTPGSTFDVLKIVQQEIPLECIAVHFHDTYGQALSNILTAVTMGISVVDSSVGGLGGCPYAAGATGNVATEEVVMMLNGLGIDTGVDLSMICKIGNEISGKLHRETTSRVGSATERKDGRLPPTYNPNY